MIVALLCGRALRPRINRLDVPVADIHEHRSYRALTDIYKKAMQVLKEGLPARHADTFSKVSVILLVLFLVILGALFLHLTILS